MSETRTGKSSETDWARIDAMTDDMIDTTEIPPLTDEWFARATLRMPTRPIAVKVSLDPDVLAWFVAQGDDWEQHLNAALRAYVEAQQART